MSIRGKFVVSLDFELMWGVRDMMSCADYKENIKGVFETLPIVLKMFDEYGIKATFATVGFLFAQNKKELVDSLPVLKPEYNDKNLSPYHNYFDQVKESEDIDRCHFAYSLLNLIKQYPEQEIASHTFSHYYCLEEGQTSSQFRADLQSAIKIAKKENINIKSLVFPRNQFSKEYLNICKELEITAYRGNESSWYYSAASGEEYIKPRRRIMRFIDRYINLSGHNCTKLHHIHKDGLYNIPSSRFLCPYNSKLKFLEKVRLNRILHSMTYAAKQNEVFHLWWHPHNFGKNQSENLNILRNILEHFETLNQDYGFESQSMNSLAQQLSNSKHEA